MQLTSGTELLLLVLMRL